jgi:predicted nucleotidyltransferase
MASVQHTSDKLSHPNRQTVRAALRELQAELRQLYGSQAPLALVYGSYARGEEKPDSDINVLLLYPRAVQPGKEIERVSAILASLNLRYQVLISILPIRKTDYQHSTGAFWQNIRKEGVSIEHI